MKIFNSIPKEKKEKEIHNLDEWFCLCPPKDKEKQWQDGRSAKEMAKFWTCEEKREDFMRFVKQVFPKADFDYAIPEFKSKFDTFHSPRQHDLLVVGSDVVVSIEGKADEPFGKCSFEKKLKEAKKEKENNKNSQAYERMKNLYQCYFNSNEGILSIKYQLLHWFAGSLSDAKELNKQNFMMVVQEFKSSSTSLKKLEANHCDFEKFIKFISAEKYSKISSKQILGPISNELTSGKNLFIGYYSI